MGTHPRSKPQSQRQPVKGAAKIGSTSNKIQALCTTSQYLKNDPLCGDRIIWLIEDLSHVSCAKATASARSRQEETNVHLENRSLAIKRRDNGRECGKRDLPWNWYGTLHLRALTVRARLQPQEEPVSLQRGEMDVLALLAVALSIWRSRQMSHNF